MTEKIVLTPEQIKSLHEFRFMKIICNHILM